MITITAKFTIIIFGLFFILVGFLMLFNPNKTRSILRKAGSTNLINYGEITIRMIPATALIIYADQSKYIELFKFFGWFMIISSLVLFLLPKRIHHNFSNKAADMIKPLCFQFISFFSFIIGGFIIYCVL